MLQIAHDILFFNICINNNLGANGKEKGVKKMKNARNDVKRFDRKKVVAIALSASMCFISNQYCSASSIVYSMDETRPETEAITKVVGPQTFEELAKTMNASSDGAVFKSQIYPVFEAPTTTTTATALQTTVTTSTSTTTTAEGTTVPTTTTTVETTTTTEAPDEIEIISEQFVEAIVEEEAAEEETVYEESYSDESTDTESPVAEVPVIEEVTETPAETAPVSTWTGPVLNSYAGTVQGPSGKETYYNLNMSGVIRIMQNLGYDYTYWVRDDGCKMYGDYIMCAANLNVHPRGSLVETSLGTAIVCDTGGFAYYNTTQLDIATTW